MDRCKEARMQRNLLLKSRKQSKGQKECSDGQLTPPTIRPLLDKTNCTQHKTPEFTPLQQNDTRYNTSNSLLPNKRVKYNHDNLGKENISHQSSNFKVVRSLSNDLVTATSSNANPECIQNSSTPSSDYFVHRGLSHNRIGLAQNLTSKFSSISRNAYSQCNGTKASLTEGINSLSNIMSTSCSSTMRNKMRRNGFQPGTHMISNNQLHFFRAKEGDIESDFYDDVQEISKQEYVSSLPNNAYLDIGDPEYLCKHCGALMWYDERVKRFRDASNPSFFLCCSIGKIKLESMHDPPPYLKSLIYEDSPSARKFRDNIRAYNMIFSFTSIGGKIDKSINSGSGPYVFRLNGQNHHLLGSLLPQEGAPPKFAQLYVYDTENEVQNRVNAVSDSNSCIDPQIVQNLKEMFDTYNTLAKKFRMARDRFELDKSAELKLRLVRSRGLNSRMYNLPSSSEVAMLIVGDIDDLNEDRDIIVETRNGVLKRIDELHPLYLPLQYPLLFPTGQDGYCKNIAHLHIPGIDPKKEHEVSIREYFAFMLQLRENQSSILLLSRRLLQQYIVDAYTMIEAQRLSFIRYNQKQLRVDLYSGLEDALLRGEHEGSACGKRVILPSSFTGGPRYMMQNYQDAMAICNWAGFPDLFITFTCNPNWPEINRITKKQGLHPQDCPQLLSRVFNIKLHHLMKDLKDGIFFGKYQAVVRTVEFQKRGLPHVHILVFLKAEYKFSSPVDVDRIVCAEIPNKDEEPHLYNAVMNFMIHGPCGHANPKSPCMKYQKCSKFFPKKFVPFTTIDEEGYPIYRRRDDGRVVIKNGVSLDNRFVVPYNPHLLMKYEAHINIEACNQSRSIKYLFKYINKGHDRATAAIYQDGSSDGNNQQVDEIKTYLDCRYISPCEAAWRIFAFDIHYRWPPVERLHFHLPNEQYVYYEDGANIDDVMRKASVAQSMFLAWMEANIIYPEARELTYAEFPSRFVYNVQDRKWYPRKHGFAIGRLHYVPPCSGERYYLRMLLTKVKGPTSYNDILTVNGILHKTFRQACYALGLLEDDEEFVEAIKEVSVWGSGECLRKLFVRMLLSGSLSRPEYVWQQSWQILSEDFQYQRRMKLLNKDIILNEEQLKMYALQEIEKLLRVHCKSLKDYPPMPISKDVQFVDIQNNLLAEELNYDHNELELQFRKLFAMMTEEQKSVFGTIMNSITNQAGGVFFVYGYGGTGKTFLWKTLTSALRSKGEIVLTVASSGIASLLLPGGRTAHSRFRIPLNIMEDSTCNIKQGSELAELLRRCKLIIWDEAPMVHKLCFEAVDRTLRDIMQLDVPRSLELPFGGKSIVFGGDFRQILPVIPGGHRSDIVHASINSSYLWKYCKVLKLTKNMRLQSNSSPVNCTELEEFAEWILKVGDGKLSEPNDGEVEVDIPTDLLLTDFQDPIEAIVNSTYPLLEENYMDPQFLKDRAILAPTLETVHKLNEYIMSQIPGEEKIYLSSDSICKASFNIDVPENLYTPEVLNSLNCSGLPYHKIILKIGIPIMLLRNIDQSAGLCNGTRLVVTDLGNHVIGAKILTGTHFGDKVFIPRMNLSPSDSKWPFKMQRRQFPIIVSYAMTINKSQGQSLAYVGLYLRNPVFCHGQLYVAISRVTSKTGLKILIHGKDNQSSAQTNNIVYKEVFQNLI